MRFWAALSSLALLPACGEAPLPHSPPAAEVAPLVELGNVCGTCRRETGEGHVCGRTALCPTPFCRRAERPVEGGPRHRCGRTSYCLACETDRGPGHDCEARTFYCPRCDADVGDEHACDRSLFCDRSECRRERSLEGGHVHGNTRYCRTCDRELPLKHAHAGFPRKG